MFQKAKDYLYRIYTKLYDVAVYINTATVHRFCDYIADFKESNVDDEEYEPYIGSDVDEIELGELKESESSDDVYSSTDEETESRVEQPQQKNQLEQLIETFRKNAVLTKYHVEVINSLDTTPEIKNVLLTYEDKTQSKYDTFYSLANNPLFADGIKDTLSTHFDGVSKSVNDFGDYDESKRTEATKLADLYKMNKFNRDVVDLYNELQDHIYKRNASLMIEDSPRFTESISSYELMPYEKRLYNFSKDLEVLQKEPERFVHLYDLPCNVADLSLYHIPADGEDYTIYRDAKNKLEYIMLYNGKWQINPYDPSYD